MCNGLDPATAELTFCYEADYGSDDPADYSVGRAYFARAPAPPGEPENDWINIDSLPPELEQALRVRMQREGHYFG